MCLMEPPQIEHKKGENYNHKALEHAFNLLNGEDDTTRLSGLTLLRFTLDGYASIREDPDVIGKCWAAIPSNFLDRLFQTQAQALKHDEQATATFGLAVAVVHAFIALIPQDRFHILLPKVITESMRTSWMKRLSCMMAGLSHRCVEGTGLPLYFDNSSLFNHMCSQPEVLLQIVQILEVFSCGHRGASLLVNVQDWTPLLKLMRGNEIARNVFQYTFATLALAAANNKPIPTAKAAKLLEYNMSILFPLFQDADNLDVLFAMLNELFEVLPHDV